MRTRNRLGVWLTAAVIGGSAVTAWAAGTMQKAPTGGTMQKAPTTQQKATTGTQPAIKVEAQSLTLTPASPKAGQQATVKFVFKNTGTGTVAKVPWSIHLHTGNQTLKADSKMNLEPGATYEATATWTPGSAGTYKLQGYVDPTGRELKNTAPVSAQVKEINVTVTAQALAQTQTSPPRLVTQILDFNKAKMAGAQFSHNEDGPSVCKQRGVFDAKNYVGHSTHSGTRTEGTVVFAADCVPGASGTRATPEAFKSFQLKNNWKIKSVEPLVNESRSGEWQWMTGPPAGANPYMKVRVWANPAGYTELVLKIVIEGPEGTDPYR